MALDHSLFCPKDGNSKCVLYLKKVLSKARIFAKPRSYNLNTWVETCKQLEKTEIFPLDKIELKTQKVL